MVRDAGTVIYDYTMAGHAPFDGILPIQRYSQLRIYIVSSSGSAAADCNVLGSPMVQVMEGYAP